MDNPVVVSNVAWRWRAPTGPGQTLTVDPATGRISFPMTAPVFGLGEGGQPGDRRGWVDSMQVGGWDDPKFPLGDWGEQMAIPWVVSPAGWGAYFHKPAGTFDLTGKGNTEGTFIPGREEGRGRRGGRGCRCCAD